MLLTQKLCLRHARMLMTQPQFSSGLTADELSTSSQTEGTKNNQSEQPPVEASLECH